MSCLQNASFNTGSALYRTPLLTAQRCTFVPLVPFRTYVRLPNSMRTACFNTRDALL